MSIERQHPMRHEKTDLWPTIHTARRQLADDLVTLADDDWRRPTLCDGWDVEAVVAHLTAGASIGRWAWLRSIVASRFRPAVHNERRLRQRRGPTPQETLGAFTTVTEATVAPTDDLPAYLGEVLVHGQDIRRPLGIPSPTAVADWVLVAEFFAARDFTVHSRTTAQGLRLVATDSEFATGEGPEVTGTTEALVMAMAGRTAYLDDLAGPGLERLAARLTG